jgi:hypothetical protein
VKEEVGAVVDRRVVPPEKVVERMGKPGQGEVLVQEDIADVLPGEGEEGVIEDVPVEIVIEEFVEEDRQVDDSGRRGDPGSPLPWGQVLK